MDLCVTMAGAALCGDCVTAETLRHVARQTGLPVWKEAQDKALEALAASGKANGTPLVLLATNLTPERLEKALGLPFFGCVEFAHEAATTGEHLLSTMEAGGLYLSLASDTAHSVEPARFYVEALQHRLELSEWQRQSIELALHEAVVNAIVHGSLEIDTSNRNTAEDFMVFVQTVEERLAQPRYGHRPVELYATWDEAEITIGVRDHGPGFDPQHIPRGGDLTRKSGRGLLLIGELSLGYEISQGGRCLTMRFQR